MNIRLLEPAQAELDEAVAWYAEQVPGLGDAFSLERGKMQQRICPMPRIGTYPARVQHNNQRQTT